jgi:hypothetical protein
MTLSNVYEFIKLANVPVANINNYRKALASGHSTVTALKAAFSGKAPNVAREARKAKTIAGMTLASARAGDRVGLAYANRAAATGDLRGLRRNLRSQQPVGLVREP